MTPSDDETPPLVSVIIPMRNEAGWLDRCLGTVLAQDYPAERLEILVADGMSDDGTYERLLERSESDSRLRVLRNPQRIVPTGLNLAIRASRGDVIARIDAHTEIAPDYVRTGVALLGRSGADNVGGPMVKLGGGPVGDAVAAAMSSRFGIGSYFQFATAEREADTVYMGMWPRKIFEKVGLFDEELVRNQDDELSYRIRKAGGRIVVSPAMRSRYQNRQSWRKLIRQFFEYGVWKVRVLQKHPRQMSVRHLVPPAFDAAVVALALSAPLGALGPALAAGGVSVYVAVVAAIAWYEARPGRRFRYATALALIHHSWAIGFLTGLVRFAGHWWREEPPAARLAPAAAPSIRGR